LGPKMHDSGFVSMSNMLAIFPESTALINLAPFAW
jgi:hypothetical protein